MLLNGTKKCNVRNSLLIVQPFSPVVYQSISHAVAQSCSLSVAQSLSPVVYQSISHAVAQSCSLSVYQSISLSVYQSISLSVFKSFSPKVLQSISRLIAWFSVHRSLFTDHQPCSQCGQWL